MDDKLNKIYKRAFYIEWPDKTAQGGVARIQILPYFDRVPSTKELVNTRCLAMKYLKEISKNKV